MGIKAALQNFYYSMEDRYYAVLDWLEAKHIPVYKIVDPIDEVIPSFALFCLIALVLALGIVWILFFTQQYYSVTVKVIELESQNPVQGVRVDYNYWLAGQQKTANFAVTESGGTFTIANLSGSLLFDFFIKKQNFEDFKNPSPVQVSLENSNVTLRLKKKISLTAKAKTIVVRDGSKTPAQDIVGKKITASFLCSTAKALPSKESFVSRIEVSAVELNNCGTVTATVSVQDFEPLTKVLDSDTTVFELAKKTVQKGSLNVTVKSFETGTRLPGIKLTLYYSSNTPVEDTLTGVDGSYTFNKEPGDYYVQASDDANHSFDTNWSSNVTIEADQTKDVTIYLLKTKPSEVKHLKIQVLDSNNNQAISGAEISFSESGVLSSSVLTTDVDGKAVFENARTSNTYYVHVKATTYVGFFGRVYPKEPNDANYTIIKLYRATEFNSGKIRVFVKDEEGSRIEGARVEVYNTAYPSIPIIDETDTSGLADLGSEKLPEGDYFAKADKRSIDANGISETKHLSNGQAIDLNVTLIAGLSFIKVKVVNKDGTAIKDANVSFFEYEASEFPATLKYETITDSSGFAGPVSFKVNKHVKIIASKQSGFLPTSVFVYNLSKTTQQKPLVKEVILYESTYANDFAIEWLYAFKPGSLEKLPAKDQKILAETEKEYGMAFAVIVPETVAPQNSVIAHARTDLDSITNEASARMVVRSASPEKFPIRSANYDSTDAFKDVNVVEDPNLNAKQVNLSFWGSLSAGTYMFDVTVLVKKVAKGTVLELHYTAKSDSKTLGDFVKTFTVGELFCKTDCPSFEYSFTLTEDKPDAVPITLQQVPEGPYTLNYNIPYTLDYTIHNTSGKNITDAFDANFSTDNEALAFGPNEKKTFTQSISQLGKDESIQQSVKLKGVLKVQHSKMKLKLEGLGMDDTNAVIDFNVKADKLSVSVPESLLPNIINQVFDVFVRDKVTEALIQGALIVVKVSNSTETGFETSFSTVSNGSVTIQLPYRGFDSSYTVYVTVSAPGYDTETVSIPFSTAFGEVQEFACVKSEVKSKACTFDATAMCFLSNDAFAGDFNISTNNCPEDISVKIQGNYGTDVSLPDITPTSFELPAQNSAQLFSVSIVYRTPAGILGQFPVYAIITGKTTGAVEKRELLVYIGYKSFSNNCFAIGKTAFDLTASGTDSNKLENYCFITHNDPNIPLLDLLAQNNSAFAMIDDASGTPASPSFAFKYRVKVEAEELVKKTIQTLQSGTYRLSVYTGGVQNITFSETTTVPDARASNLTNIYDAVTNAKKIKILARHPGALQGGQDGLVQLNDSTIDLKIKNPDNSSSSLTVSVPNCTAPCSMPALDCALVDSEANVGDVCGSVEIQLSDLNIETATFNIVNPLNNSNVYLDVEGTLVSSTQTAEYTTHNFTAFSEWRDDTVRPGFEAGIQLGSLSFGLAEIKQSPDYKGGRIIDVNYSIITDPSTVEAWIQEDKVYGAYYGAGKSLQIENDAEIIPFTIFDNGWKGDYTVLNVDDYATPTGGRT